MSDIDSRVDHAVQLFRCGYACSQAMLMAFSGKYGPDPETCALLAAAFGGGMGRLRLTCGALTGAFMVLGLRYGNALPGDMESKLECYRMVRKLAREFEALHGTVSCGELLQKYCPDDSAVKARRHHRMICDAIVRDAASILSLLV